MWPTTASRSMPCGAPPGQGSSSRGLACRWPRRSWPCPHQFLRPLLRSGQRADPPVLPAAGELRLHQGGAAMSTFTSNFAPQIEAMLEWRTSLGHTLRDMRNAMAGFDRFCSSHHPGETVLTRELATAWCRDTATGTWGAYRSRAVREFGKYLQLTGVEGFI